LLAGGKDRIVPRSIVKANFDLYRESKADTDYKEFPDQTHFSLLRETRVADYVLAWALCRANGSKLTAFPKQTDAWSVQPPTQRKGELICQLQPPHLLLQKLLRHQQRLRAPSRENHCPLPTV